MSYNLKKPCKGRTRKICRRARRSCKMTKGSQRKYCRKTRNTRRSRK